MRFLPWLLAALLVPFGSFAQKGAIGQWQSHYPYNILTGLASDGEVIHAASVQGFFSYRPSTGEVIRHSKVDGMSDAGTDKVGYDTLTETTVITYQNGNIDLYRRGSFFNIPSIRLRPASGSKAITDVYCTNGLAYLSLASGGVVIDLDKQEIRENYVFGTQGRVIPITSIRVLGSFVYAGTPAGLYRASRTGINRQDFSVWERVLPDTIQGMALSGQQLWLHTGRRVFTYQEGQAPLTVFRSANISHLDPALEGVSVSQVLNTNGAIYGRIHLINSAGIVTDSFRAAYPLASLQAADGAFYTADFFSGFQKRTAGFEPTPITISGPARPDNFQISATNRKVEVLHGGYNQNFVPKGVPGDVSTYDVATDTWTVQRPFGNNARDLIASVGAAEGTYYGSMQDGMYLSRPDGTIENLTDAVLEPYLDDPSRTLKGVMSATKDLSGNIIIGQYKALSNELAVRTKGGQWVHLSAEGSSFVGGLPRTAAGLLTDDYGNLWWFQPRGGGVFVYNHNNTPENPADDKSAHLGTGKGGGGLPSASVLSMVKDLDGTLWIGTENGLAVVNCPGNVIGGTCEASQPIVKLDQFPGLLFDNEQVQALAVDGANRKWVGTNNGVWLISADAQQVVERFTVDNSPLPSNAVQRISVDPVTGDVYIGTSNGLVSYRGTAIAGSETTETVLAFPNPVRSDYHGPVSFRNLPANADVRITDISGQLVYRATATGGQAVWNGLDYTGKRPQTGVYLVFVTTKDGLTTTKGKFVFAE
jgi:hypothetical protein